jgi:hypothetical protein
MSPDDLGEESTVGDRVLPRLEHVGVVEDLEPAERIG